MQRAPSAGDSLSERVTNPVPAAGKAPHPGLADRAFARATGSEPIDGNAVRLLQDATENFPAWLDAIRDAERSILFENYIIDDDEVGREFAAALAAKARAGIDVRVVYDWLGSRDAGALWLPLTQAGAQVRAFNRPRLDSPLGWLSRDHRKTITVDGRVGFVSGLCVSAKWLGDPARRMDPWRDTGVEIRGPAVIELARAFAEVWQACGGDPLPGDLTAATEERRAPAGDVRLRVIAGAPNETGTYRLDLVIASLARRHLWLADAYFVGTSAYVQALAAAARDGVDVRLLVPGASDIPALSPISRAGYRPLLDAGVRVFEWNGTMLHAKTAVADELWARIGSTNLNIASWMGNYELDVAVEDRGFGAAMAAQYERDLTQGDRDRADPPQPRAARGERREPGGAPGAGRQRGARRGRRGQRRQRARRGADQSPCPRGRRVRASAQSERGRRRVRHRRHAVAPGHRVAARGARCVARRGVVREGPRVAQAGAKARCSGAARVRRGRPKWQRQRRILI